MVNPGSNLYAKAVRLIAQQTVAYLAFVSRATQPNGIYLSTYASPVMIRTSFQPVQRALMQLLGLDMNKSYANIFVPQTVIDIARDVTSDQFQFNGATYQALSITPWFAIDGWNQVLVVLVPGPFIGIVAGEDGVAVAGETKQGVEGG